MKSKKIGLNQTADSEFARLLEANLEKTTALEPGSVVEITIKAIDSRDYISVEFESGSGVIERSELLDAQSRIRYTAGEKIKAFYQALFSGEHRFTLQPSGRNKRSMLQAAMERRMPLYGKVLTQIKGGYEIEIGEVQAFSPGSQMQKENAAPGSYAYVLVTELPDRRVIVSERAYLDELRAKRRIELSGSLKEGDIVAGTVASVQNFGIFVDLGGMEGLVPRSEISYPGSSTQKSYRHGEEVRARVLALDWKEGKITLSIRSLLENPWQGKLPFEIGEIVSGTVESIKNFGIFVKLPGNFTGLVPASESGLPRGSAFDKEFKKNAPVRVMVADINREKEKIGLSISKVKDHDTRQEYEEYMAGQSSRQTENISSFGKQLLASLKKDK